MNKKIAVIGYGSMGRMLLLKYLQTGIDETSVYVANRTYEKMNDLRVKYPRLNICRSNIEAAKDADIIFVCVKALEIKNILLEIVGCIKHDCHIVSLNANILLSQLEKICCDKTSSNKTQKISKMTPSITGEVSQSITLVTHNNHVNDDDKTELYKVLNCIGAIDTIVEIPETETAIALQLTSCMPGFIAAIFKVFVDEAATRTSLPKNKIMEMVTGTLYGTGKLLFDNRMQFDEMIERVATKGGITEEGIKVIENKLPQVIDELFYRTMAKEELVTEKVINDFDK
jgi:pyrroline-5-carboxylate reductase